MGRTLPVSATQSPGYLITGALWNAGPFATNAFLLNPPIFRGVQSSTQSISANVWTALSIDTTTVDSDNGHSNVTNNSRYTAQVTGWYWVEGYLATTGNPLGRMATSIAKNGTQIIGSMQTTTKYNDLQSVGGGCMFSMNAGDYAETWGWQSSSGSLNTFNGTDLACCMNVFWVHS